MTKNSWKHRMWWYWWALMAIVFFVLFTPCVIFNAIIRYPSDAIIAGMNEIGRVMHYHSARGWPAA